MKIAVYVVKGSLQIRHSLESDEGKYECVAENTVGVAYSYGANLYLRGKSEILTRKLRRKSSFILEFYQGIELDIDTFVDGRV